MKISRIVLSVSILGAIVLSLVQIVFFSAFATDGIELTRMQNEQMTLEKENSIGISLITNHFFCGSTNKNHQPGGSRSVGRAKQQTIKTGSK